MLWERSWEIPQMARDLGNAKITSVEYLYTYSVNGYQALCVCIIYLIYGVFYAT